MVHGPMWCLGNSLRVHHDPDLSPPRFKPEPLAELEFLRLCAQRMCSGLASRALVSLQPPDTDLTRPGSPAQTHELMK